MCMILSLLERVLLSVFEHLFQIVVVIDDLVIRYISLFVGYRHYVRIDEALVRLKVERGITLQNLFVQVVIYIDRVSLYKVLACLVVSFGFDSLNLFEQLSVEICGGQGSPLIIK